ncbi:MAG: hypothetical protein ACRDIY_17300 [Chloroflexota bacterium]
MRNLEPGFHVIGSDGTEIGTIANCSREYCEVTTGILGLGQPIYVPMDAITQTQGNSVFLNVSSQRVADMNWTQRPVGETCATGYYGTMPAGQAEPAPTTPETGALSPSAIEAVGRGWPIICSEGKQVGTVASTRPGGLVMERGWFIFRQRVLVPARTIERIDDIGHRVYLAVGCGAVNQFPSV